jgi:hypothetical protein
MRARILLLMFVLGTQARAATVRNLGFGSTAQNVVVNTCSQAVVAQTQDYAFQATNTTSDVVVSPTGTFNFYSDAGCTSSISTVTIRAGTSSAVFYFKALASGSQVLRIAGGGLNAGTQTETITTSAPSCPPPSGGSGGSGGTGGSTLPPPIPAPNEYPGPYPASQAWMTEQEEVDWLNSLGFTTSVAQLRAAYSRFQVTTPNFATCTDQLSETDDLRNFYRLYKRTGHQPFLQQAQIWYNHAVGAYSDPSNTSCTHATKSHLYVMGLIDWWVDHQDATTLTAINRLIDFTLTIPDDNPFVETRVSARAIEALAYYLEKIGTRSAEVRPKLQRFLDGVANAPMRDGFSMMPKFFQWDCGGGGVIDDMPVNIDLRTQFASNYSRGIVCDARSFKMKGFAGVSFFQDQILMHALRIAGRVLNDPSLVTRAQTIGRAWLKYAKYPFYDANGATRNFVMPYVLIPDAPDTSMFLYWTKSTPLYVSQYAPFCPDANTRKTLAQDGLLRAYNEPGKIGDNERQGEPRFYPFQMLENAYFMTQK